MGLLLLLMSFAAFAIGGLVLFTVNAAIQQTLGVLVLLIAAVLFVGAAIVNALAKLERAE